MKTQVYAITRQTFVQGLPIKYDNPVVVIYQSHDRAISWLSNLAKQVGHGICHKSTSPDILESLTLTHAGNTSIYTIIQNEVL